MIRSIFILIYTVCVLSTVLAQKKADLSQRLRVGTNLPILPDMEALFAQDDRVSLNADGKKVVLLEFFDTYCSICISSFPKLQTLRDEMLDKLEIVLVTWQDRETIEKFWKNNAWIKKHDINLPVIYGDTILRKYFPHKGTPHVVWLNMGKVRAITQADFVDSGNVLKFYDYDEFGLPTKEDFVPEDNIGLHPNVLGGVRLSGYIEGMPKVGGLTTIYDEKTGFYKTTFFNVTIFGAYTAIWSQIKKPKFILLPERIVWNVADSSRYKYYGESGKSNIWLTENGISYERIDKIKYTGEEQAKRALSDLNGMLGLNTYWSEQMRPVVVLKKAEKKINNEREKDGQILEGSSVLAFMLDYSGKFPPVVDEANTTDIIYLSDYDNLEELNEQIELYGLSAKLEFRSIEVFVLEESK